jgi:hypothetical protein
MGHLPGYARVSTTDQQPQLQVDALERAGDTLVVWKLDRLGRSLRHLVDTVTGLADRGVGLRASRKRLTPPPPAASWCSTCSPPWPSSNVTSSANAPPPDCPQPGPAAATAADPR